MKTKDIEAGKFYARSTSKDLNDPWAPRASKVEVVDPSPHYGLFDDGHGAKRVIQRGSEVYYGTEERHGRGGHWIQDEARSLLVRVVVRRGGDAKLSVARPQEIRMLWDEYEAHYDEIRRRHEESVVAADQRREELNGIAKDQSERLQALGLQAGADFKSHDGWTKGLELNPAGLAKLIELAEGKTFQS